MASTIRNSSDASIPVSHHELDDQVRFDGDAAPQPPAELAPADGGRQARLVLISCSLLQLPIWG